MAAARGKTKPKKTGRAGPKASPSKKKRLPAATAKPRASTKVRRKRTARATTPAKKQRKKRATTKPSAPERTFGAPAVPAPPPSFHDTARALVMTPEERPLTDDERTAMGKVAETARRFLAAEGMGDGIETAADPGGIIVRIGAFLDAVRSGARPKPKNPDVELGLGILWGEQLRAQVGWLWVHLTYPNHFYSYALVPDDRAFACFPINRLVDLMQPSARSNTSVRLFEAIRGGELPTPRKRDAYLVIG